jgi:hypothetical protein
VACRFAIQTCMRTITIPEPIAVGIAGSPPRVLTFQSVLEESWLQDNSFGKDYAGLKRAMRLSELFKDKVPGDSVTLDNEDWGPLANAVRAPSVGQGGGYIPSVGRQILPFLEAVLDAVEVDATTIKKGRS